jgi:hypothetical protein
MRGLGTIRTCVSRRGAQRVDEDQAHIGNEQKALLKREFLFVCVCAGDQSGGA